MSVWEVSLACMELGVDRGHPFGPTIVDLWFPHLVGKVGPGEGRNYLLNSSSQPVGHDLLGDHVSDYSSKQYQNCA